MESLTAAAWTALWLGIMTSISPCPLATNIAAISFIGKRVEKTKGALFTSLFYVIGRLVAYVALGIVIAFGVLSIPGVSNFLQKYMNMLLGPLLIVVGVILLDWIPIRIPGMSASQSLQDRVGRGSTWGASLLGALFALTFCPVSAALFFGSLIPLTVQHHSYILLPTLFGIGTGLPVIAFGLLIAFSTHAVAKVFHRVTQIEYWVRKIGGALFIVVGIYLTLTNWFGLSLW
jgi:cytochrome c biogenesis protein CcdA